MVNSNKMKRLKLVSYYKFVMNKVHFWKVRFIELLNNVHKNIRNKKKLIKFFWLTFLHILLNSNINIKVIFN